MVEVDPDDPALEDPTKFVGKVCSRAEAEKEAAEKGWIVKPDGACWRRVVPSPLPERIFRIEPIRVQLEARMTDIAAGGGGIPTMYDPARERKLVGVECVIDKDRASCLLARELGADVLVIAPDAPAVFLGFGTPDQRAIRPATPDALDAFAFPAGSMGPKVEAALRGEAGTTVSVEAGETRSW